MRATHPEPITRATLRSLAEFHNPPVVSIFQPTLRATFEEQQYRNRLKTLLARSESLLTRRGLKRAEIDRLLDPARRLIPDEGFWRERLDGLAIYAAPDFLRTYWVPFSLPELVEVADTPCIRPLVPALATDGYFYVLAISRNMVRLFRGNTRRLDEIDLAPLDVPSSLAEALRYDDIERAIQSHATGRAEVRLQTHSQAEARSGRHVWHGHGFGAEDVKEEVARFFAAVDTGLHEVLADEQAPLIIAAVAYEQDLFRSISKYAHVTPQGIEGNPDRASAKDLHSGALTIASQSHREKVDAAKLAYREASSAGDASNDLGEILRATHAGRVATLLLRTGADVWGTYEPATGNIETHAEPAASDTDLLDLAVQQTLLHGGEVYALETDAMPSTETMAAVYRY